MSITFTSMTRPRTISNKATASYISNRIYVVVTCSCTANRICTFAVFLEISHCTVLSLLLPPVISDDCILWSVKKERAEASGASFKSGTSSSKRRKLRRVSGQSDKDEQRVMRHPRSHTYSTHCTLQLSCSVLWTCPHFYA